jgi:hypothetical protein
MFQRLFLGLDLQDQVTSLKPSLRMLDQEPLNTRTIVKRNFLTIKFLIRICHHITTYHLCIMMTN